MVLPAGSTYPKSTRFQLDFFGVMMTIHFVIRVGDLQVSFLEGFIPHPSMETEVNQPDRVMVGHSKSLASPPMGNFYCG